MADSQKSSQERQAIFPAHILDVSLDLEEFGKPKNRTLLGTPSTGMIEQGDISHTSTLLLLTVSNALCVS